MSEQKPLLEAQLFGVEFEVYQTPRGYLLAWSDYVANTWVEAYETLPEVMAKLQTITINN